MSSQARRAIFAAMIMILASLAGCIGSDDIASDDGTESLGTVIASTYHVEQLASAVGGDLVSVEMMSTMNIPVHDYEPSATDLIRLNQADVFFYHGLGLEPLGRWSARQHGQQRSRSRPDPRHAKWGSHP